MKKRILTDIGSKINENTQTSFNGRNYYQRLRTVRVAALKLVDAIIAAGYKVETLDKVCEKKIKISDYVEKEETIEKRD